MDSSSDVGLWLADVGLWLVELVLAIATWLTGSEAAPGLVSLGLLLALVVCIFLHGYFAGRFNRAVRSARSILRAENGEQITRERVIDIDGGFGELGQRSGPEHRLAIAWSEFRETTVLPERDAVPLRNTVRPAAFFAREELGLDHGIWRYVPALFVSVGLLLTFLGLVAALDQTGRILDSASQEAPVLDADGQRLDQTGPILDDAPVRNEVDATTKGLKTLLRIAGAKFIMSLTGLLCSILFTLMLRGTARRTDRALRDLCTDIENGCVFLSEQNVLDQMLTQAREQTSHLQAFSTELVAQIATPLREVPQAIRESIEQAMENVSRSTSDGIESLAGTVSEQLAGGIQDSVEAMNRTIGEVGDRLQTVADRLDTSAGAMGTHVDQAVQALAGQIEALKDAMSASSQTAADTLDKGAETLLLRMQESLQTIRSDTTAGARAIREASDTMAGVAAGLSQTIQERVNAAAEASGQEIKDAGHDMASGIREAASEMRQHLLDPMANLTEQIRNLASRVETATQRVGDYAGTVEGSAGAVKSANEELGQAAKTLADATAPVRGAVDRIESAGRTMVDRVEAVSGAMLSGVNKTTEHTEAAMRGAREAIAASQTAVREGLDSLKAAVVGFKQVLGRYGEIDRSLGDAFQEFETAVRSSIEEIQKFQQTLNTEFGKALDRLEAVIAQAEPFTPRRDE